MRWWKFIQQKRGKDNKNLEENQKGQRWVHMWTCKTHCKNVTHEPRQCSHITHSGHKI